MKYSIALIVFAATMASARFGQEQAPAQIIGAAAALFDNGSDSGQISTFAGGSIGTVLGAADPCGIYALGDQMIEFGKGKLTGEKLTTYINIVRDAIAVEKNFNPFGADKRASICLDPVFPGSNELRGILPLVDPTNNDQGAPALQGGVEANGKTAQINADIKSGAIDGVAQAAGKSIGQQMLDVVGFSDFQKSETLNAGAGAGAGTGAGAGAGGAGAGGAGDAGGANDGGAGGANDGEAGGANDGGAGGANDGGAGGAAAGGEDAATIIARIEQGLNDLKAACAADAAN